MSSSYTNHTSVLLYTPLTQNVYSHLYLINHLKFSLSPNPVPSGPPLSFQATPVNSTTLQLTWAPPAREKRNGIVREYMINATALESGDHFQWMSPTTSLIVSGLHPHYHYNLIIAAITIGPSGPFSDVHSVLMPENGKCNSSYFNMVYSLT